MPDTRPDEWFAGEPVERFAKAFGTAIRSYTLAEISDRLGCTEEVLRQWTNLLEWRSALRPPMAEELLRLEILARQSA